MRHLVIGAGEVGSAVHTVLERVLDASIRDVEPFDIAADVLHVCFPWSDQFATQVASYAHSHDAGLVIVHSTVPVGTCDPRGWVHSPVRGRHPHLVEGLDTFIKHFGGLRATEAAAIFDAAGLRVETHATAAETEAGKLWELVQYGTSIQVEKQIHAWCETNGIDFETVYTRFAETYNDGYLGLGHPELVRPVLRHVPGPIGGHCVARCSALLDHPLADMVRAPAPETLAS